MAATHNSKTTTRTVVLYLAFELGETEWKLALTIGVGQKPRLRSMPARDLPRLYEEIAKAKRRFGLAADAPVRSCYEAGRDGFWLHRHLQANGVDNAVVDSASIEVNRRQRRTKTDRLDAGKLLNLLLRYHGGERKVWSIVHVPSAADEDARQLHRELQELKDERTEHVNRIKGLLASQVNAFFQQLTRERLHKDEHFVAVLEVCGFNDWLIRMLHHYRCHKVILIQPDDRKKRKTDRRDAAALSELLWVNRHRLLQGKPVRGLRQIDMASSTDQENRRLTTLRKEAGQARTRLVNKIKHIIRRHNLQWEMPTKRLPSKSAIAWLKQLVLPEIDRLEMDHLLTDLERVQQRLKELEGVIAKHCGVSKEAVLLSSMPGVGQTERSALPGR
jgi:transposase